MGDNNKNQLQEQKKMILNMIAEGSKSHGEVFDKDDSRYSVDTEEGAQIYASFSDEELLDLLRESAHQMGKCVVVVTHSRELAREADVVFRLKRGTLVTA